MSRITDLPLSHLTHTSPRPTPVPSKEVNSTFPTFCLPLDALAFHQASPPDHSQLPSMPATGHNTKMVCSTTAVPALTTLSSWSELTPTESGKSRILGEPHGEREDTSDWLPAIPVVSVLTEVSMSHDFDFIDYTPDFFFLR